MAKLSQNTTNTCAICGKPQDEGRYKPFCSKRCADVDLNRWLTGRYVIPGAEITEDDEAQQAVRPAQRGDD